MQALRCVRDNPRQKLEMFSVLHVGDSKSHSLFFAGFSFDGNHKGAEDTES